MKYKLLTTVLAFTLLSGCSSIVSKSNYPVAISSNPDGAIFEITNRARQKVQNGVTPATVTLKSSAGFFKKEAYTITLTKEGFATQTFTLRSSLDGWYFGNILLGGLIGMLIVDPATGAMYKLPDRVDISLDQDMASTKEDTFTIATIDSLTNDQRAQLVRVR